MDYNNINLISNYLASTNNKEFYNIINDILIGNDDIISLKYKINQSKDIKFINESSGETLNYSSLIFCKFAKESVFECLYNINQHFYIYELGTNNYENCLVLNYLNKLGFSLDENNLLNKQINKNNTMIIGHDGMHFFPHCSSKLISANFINFGEKLIMGINDPQLLDIPEMSIINPNDFKFKNIYIQKIYNPSPLLLKEILQHASKDRLTFNKLIAGVGENNENIFDALIDNFKMIEYAEENLNYLKKYDNIQKIKQVITINSQNYEIKKYIDVANFLSNAKEIYLDLLNKNNIFPIAEFVSKLDEICPGELHIFDEKYQIEQFRETYGGKEFKEKFLNNLSKTAEDLSDKEIKKLFLHKKGFIRKTKQEEICDIILNYNKENKTKQIPILMLVNNFKELDKNNLEKLEQIINEYINGNTEYLYDYLVREEKLDLIIEKINPKLDQIIKNNTDEEKQQEQISISIDKAR